MSISGAPPWRRATIATGPMRYHWAAEAIVEMRPATIEIVVCAGQWSPLQRRPV